MGMVVQVEVVDALIPSLAGCPLCVCGQVRKPNLGERIPSLVKAEIRVDLAAFHGTVSWCFDARATHGHSNRRREEDRSADGGAACGVVLSGAVRAEWDSLREHDVVFLLTIENPEALVNEPPPMSNGKGGKKGQGQKKKDNR